MVEWPGRCRRCNKEIEAWSDAGFHDGRWIHKACFTQALLETGVQPDALPALRSPEERVKQLELPMIIFLLMFHFGLGGAVSGWIMLDQNGSQSTAAILLAIGVIVPLIGVAGVALNIISRRRVELIHQELVQAGGWKPGR
ncbi:MAG TPA: hypothetical protein VI759_03785 [Dehalococcoidia bacterium]|nr:hypothetical protein [Dehalococcoidia bacterium]